MINKKKTNLTVIVPYYNNTSAEINRSIESILDQKKIKFRIIILIVDDKSLNKMTISKLNNRIKKKIKKRKNFKLKILRKTKNSGDSDTRLMGVRNSNSEYIAFLDSDDYWKPYKLYHQFNLIKKCGCEIIGTDWNSKTHFKKFLYPLKNYYKLDHFSVALKWWPHISTLLLKRDSFFLSNAKLSKNYRHAGDGEVLLKLAKYKKIYVLKKNLTICHSFKINPYDSGMSSNLDKMHKGELVVINKNFSNNFLKIIFILILKIKFIFRKYLIN